MGGFPFRFTGEQLDDNGLLYLRARYYAPELGVFTALDPLEGDVAQAMSLNRYGYVAGNVINSVDPSGMYGENPGERDEYWQTSDSCSECKQIYLDRVPGIKDRVFWGPHYYAAWQSCSNVCPLWGGGPSTPPPPSNPCDPSRLPPVADILSTFSGTIGLDPNRYSWWAGNISDVKITFYGARALRDQSVTHPSQISAQESWGICCGQGSVSIGGKGYRCKLNDTSICNSPPQANFRPDWDDNDMCGAHPILANGSCAVPGQTGAALVRPSVAGIAGIDGSRIGRMFAYVIPANGDYNQGTALYINDGGSGAEFFPRQIDVYAGVLDESSQPRNDLGT